MSTAKKIRALCEYNNVPVSKLEQILGFSNGSLRKNNQNSMRADRIRDIATYFGVTPTYIMTDMTFCVCPVCSVAFNPLDESTIETHKQLHENYVNLRSKIGYLLNPTQAATKRIIAENSLGDADVPDDGKVFHYETMVQCDFAEYAYFNNFKVDISYSDFIKDEIQSKKYFELIPESVIKNLIVKYNVSPSEKSHSVIDMYQSDKEFMSNISDLWDLPQDLRHDVYKSIRHAKRDYADREYYTNPYANNKVNV